MLLSNLSVFHISKLQVKTWYTETVAIIGLPLVLWLSYWKRPVDYTWSANWDDSNSYLWHESVRQMGSLFISLLWWSDIQYFAPILKPSCSLILCWIVMWIILSCLLHVHTLTFLLLRPIWWWEIVCASSCGKAEKLSRDRKSVFD